MLGRNLSVTIVLVIVALSYFQGPALAITQITQEEAAKSVSEAFAVRVLKVREGEFDGQAVWLVTVMKDGGERNDAFQVTTLAIDRETGQLVPAFRHLASGYLLPGIDSKESKTGLRPDAARSRTWR